MSRSTTAAICSLYTLMSCAPAVLPEPVAEDTAQETVAPPRCDPVATVQGTDHTEGDVITVELACSSGVDPSTFTPSIYSASHDFGLDPNSWTALLETDTADAGPVELVLMVTGSDLPETVAVELWIADAWYALGNEPVDPKTYTREYGLPVLHVAADEPLSDEYTTGAGWFDGDLYDLEIKWRGAASLGYPKHSFTLKFPDPDENHLDASEWGLRNKDHLVLITTFDDNSYIRQKLVYDMWADISSFWGVDRLVPRTFFTVLYLDGRYHGLFLASDHVDNQFVDQMGLNRLGNLYKSVNHDANFKRTNAGGNDKATLHDGYEKKEGPEDVWTDLESLVAFVADSDSATFWDQAPAWLRVDEFMDWYLFVHYTASDDSAGKNAYLYNDVTATEFRYAPWDFNHALGQNWYTARVAPDVYNDFRWNNQVFVHLQDHPEAANQLWDRYAQMRAPGGPLHLDSQLANADSAYEAIDTSARKDWNLWSTDYRNYGWGGGARDAAADWTDYDGERAYLYQWLEERDQAMTTFH
jgi:hypothetical protein